MRYENSQNGRRIFKKCTIIVGNANNENWCVFVPSKTHYFSSLTDQFQDYVIEMYVSLDSIRSGYTTILGRCFFFGTMGLYL